MSPSTLYQQETTAERHEPLGLEKRSYQVSKTTKGDRLFDDFHRRSSPLLNLPKIPMSTSNHSYFQKKLGPKKTTDEDSQISFIDGILEVINLDYNIDEDEEEEKIDDNEVMIVPVKLDNYVNKRKSRFSRGDRRKNELLLDNAFAITDALRALQQADENMGGLVLSSGDEESLDADDIDDGYDSDQL